MLATMLHQRNVPIAVVENALVLAATRRMIHPEGRYSLAKFVWFTSCP